MILPVLNLLQGVGVKQLRRLGIQALRHALKERRAEVVGVALARLTKDDDLTLLATDRPLFVRVCVFALLRAVFDFDGGGRLADIARDAFCEAHSDEVVATVAGITDGRQAVEKVLTLMVQGL